jgi:hypothetical protein
MCCTAEGAARRSLGGGSRRGGCADYLAFGGTPGVAKLPQVEKKAKYYI